MKRILSCLCLAAATAFLACAAFAQTRPDERATSPLAGSRQMLLVITADWDSVPGTMQRFERANDRAAWKPVGEPFPIVVGKSGLGWGRGVASDLAGNPAGGPVKKEGDGKGPAGVYRLGTAFGQSKERLAGLRLPYLFLSDDVECVDDAASKHYNQVLTKQQAGQPDWNSSEKMWQEPLYKWGVVVLHNTPAQAAGGSCIFLHTWKAPDRGTAGCTAMEESNLTQTMKWLDPAKKPLLVQLPRAEYERLKTEWQSP